MGSWAGLRLGILQGTLTQWVAVPSGLEGPRPTVGQLVARQLGERLEQGQGVCPSLYEEAGVRTASICFHGGETEALNGPVPGLAAGTVWACAQNLQGHTGWHTRGWQLGQPQALVCSTEEWVEVGSSEVSHLGPKPQFSA